MYALNFLGYIPRSGIASYMVTYGLDCLMNCQNLSKATTLFYISCEQCVRVLISLFSPTYVTIPPNETHFLLSVRNISSYFPND